MTAAHLAGVVRARLGASAYLRASREGDCEVIVVERERWLPTLQLLRADPDAQLELLVDLFAIDRGADASPRFELRAALRSPRLGYRAHVVLELSAEDAAFPSLTGVFAAAETLERELFELSGVAAEGHPHLRPWLLYPGFVGHPLRKDYRAHKEQPLVPMLDAAELGIAPPDVVADVAETAAPATPSQERA